MSEVKRSRAEVLRQGIVEAVREATALLAARDRGAKARACVERAQSLVAELKALSQRIGSAEGYDDAVRMPAMIEELQAKLKLSTSSER
jgi:hypothetical protein